MDCGPDDEHQHGHGDAVEWKKVAKLRAVVEDQDPAAKIHTSVVIGHGHGGDDAEWKKVAELRAVAEAQDPASKEEDDFALRRFLRARDNNNGKALAMLLQYLAWKRVAKPHCSTSDDGVRDELVEDRVHMQGFDGLNRPMAYLYGARHFPAPM